MARVDLLNFFKMKDICKINVGYLTKFWVTETKKYLLKHEKKNFYLIQYKKRVLHIWEENSAT